MTISKSTIKELVKYGEAALLRAGVDNAAFDAEALAGHVLGLERQQIFLHPDSYVEEEHKESYEALVRRRANGEPLQYITEEQYFLGFRFIVNPSVLIPRPETELLAVRAIDWAIDRAGGGAIDNASACELSVLDLCTGSGVLAISIAIACREARVIATDVSNQALVVASENARALGVADRVRFIMSDLFESLELKFDLIVTNPPYVRTGELPGLQREIREFEPKLALDGGDDGLRYYPRIAAGAKKHLKNEGLFLAEIGFDQARSVKQIFCAAGFSDIEIFQDLAGRDRILAVRANS